MVALFSGVEGSVVVLVPVLVSATAGEGRIVCERNNGPVLTHELVAGRHHAWCVDNAQYLGNEDGGHGRAGVGGPLLLLVDPLMDVHGNAQTLGR